MFPWLPLLHRELEDLLSLAQIEGDFRDDVLSGLCRPGGLLHGDTSIPGSALVFLFAQGLGGRYECVLPAGLAVELLVSASHLLDIVGDADGEAGLAQASVVNQAAALLLLANLSLARVGRGNDATRSAQAVELLQIAALRACRGQGLDLTTERQIGVSEGEYLQMTRWKTAVPLACACQVGALLSTDDRVKIEAAAGYGEWLGMARQIRNDALGILGGG